MLLITSLFEELLPVMTDFPIQPVLNIGDRLSVGVAKFNSPQVALKNALKTKIDGETVVSSDDYKLADKNNDNGGTPKDIGEMKQFKVKF